MEQRTSSFTDMILLPVELLHNGYIRADCCRRSHLLLYAGHAIGDRDCRSNECRHVGSHQQTRWGSSVLCTVDRSAGGGRRNGPAYTLLTVWIGP